MKRIFWPCFTPCLTLSPWRPGPITLLIRRALLMFAGALSLLYLCKETVTLWQSVVAPATHYLPVNP